jgi:hypothetical protein
MLASTVSIRITTAGVDVTIGGDPMLDLGLADRVVKNFSMAGRCDQRTQAQVAAANRFEKLDANLQPVRPDSKSWAHVRDNTTGLIWTADNVTEKAVSWEKASKACAALDRGFRLPSRAELLTLVDDTKHDPCIDTEYFRDVKSSWYWTSTPAAWSAGCAWIVTFGDGGAGGPHRDGLGFVRAVRSAVPAGQ